MTNADKLKKTMDEASREYEKLPDWAKSRVPKTPSGAVVRTVRPTSETFKKR